uniref:Putative cuticle protein 6 n=1 Tax=Phlebotomus kandelakii TaxID=1109342 RepID=A0A6B2EB45_9DIPT
MKCLVIFAMLATLAWSETIMLLDLSPEEAQKYIGAQSLDLRYAKKLGEERLSSLRSLNGEKRDFYHNGRLIDNPEDYVQEEFEANQFHGQDGLGRAMFGYTDWNQARLEARNANGEVRGSYQYVDPNGEDYVVNYWADSLGFHQMDNRPKVVLEPVTDTPEVQAARLAHEQAWAEAARAAKANPDPNSDLYNLNANRLYEDQAKQEQTQQLLTVANQAQSLTRYPNLPYTITPDKSASSSQQDSVVVEVPQETRTQYQVQQKSNYRQDEEEEVTGEPRGFFYNFDYPVQLIRSLEETRKVKRQNSEAPETPQVSARAAAQGSVPIDAIHDTQVHPKQKDNVPNSQVLPVLVHNK